MMYHWKVRLLYHFIPKDKFRLKKEKKKKRNDLICDIYGGSYKSMRTVCGATSTFPIGVGSHKESTLSTYQFTLIIDN